MCQVIWCRVKWSSVVIQWHVSSEPESCDPVSHIMWSSLIRQLIQCYVIHCQVIQCHGIQGHLSSHPVPYVKWSSIIYRDQVARDPLSCFMWFSDVNHVIQCHAFQNHVIAVPCHASCNPSLNDIALQMPGRCHLITFTCASVSDVIITDNIEGNSHPCGTPVRTYSSSLMALLATKWMFC